jgi:shikimate 5-dehydrogenase
MFQAEAESWDRLGNLRWDLLVNATPVGMHPDISATPISENLLTGDWVYDIVYNPAETRLLAEAKRHGCKTIAGSEMFLGQAWKQQALWCSTPTPEHVLETALQDALSPRDCLPETSEERD